jgi:predicted Zn-dependent peptidase
MRTSLKLLSSLVLAATALVAAARSAHAVELPYKKTKLANGLTVIVHEDHALPTVAVNLLYLVGSRDEEAKRTGFAHLFEHLMFMGTTRVPLKMFDAYMEAAGGSNNAWTSNDQTDYHEVGPPGSLPLLLWLEADRLETLGREIDATKLDLQRDVVRNERRQTSENTPYGKVELRLPELLYPEGHPYHHPVIGSHEDLEAAKVEDVRAFFAKHYVPKNASLVIAGDVKTDEVLALVDRYFTAIPGGEKTKRLGRMDPPKLGRVVRETMTDNVELPKIIVTYHSPGKYADGDAQLDLFASAFASGKASRLYKALVYDKPLAQSVEAGQQSQDLSSQFRIEVTARPETDLDELERALDAVVDDALKKPPTEAEMKRAKNELEFAFVARLQSMAARASLMNQYEAAFGEPNAVDKDLGRYRSATAKDVSDWANKTLTKESRVIVRVVPKGKAVTSGEQTPPGAKPPQATKVKPKKAGKAGTR